MCRSAVVLCVVVLSSAVVSSAPAKLPSSFKVCKVSDPKFNDCLKVAVQGGIAEAAKGISSLGVLPIDPLLVTAISIGRGSGPVDITLDFKNTKISGLGALKVESVTFDTKKMKSQGKISVSTPVNLQGDYKMDGKILILPITGEGKCNLTLDNLDADFHLEGESVKHNGETYMKITNFGFSFRTRKLFVNFQNLFNGDKTLGDSTNKFLNENWEGILNELKPAIETTFGATFREIANRIFLKVPYNKIFLN